ncbi:MAG: N-acetyl-alpha-D-glucosaminyl L-malate synthase BshA [Planctomycetota bacterium]
MSRSPAESPSWDPVNGVTFHEVRVPPYPLFRYPPYALALASKMVEVVQDTGVELLHVHYAIPHAVSAVLAKEMLGGGVKVVTTLHGTDVTLVGQDKSYLAPTRFGIERSDAVTAVSEHLRAQTDGFLCRNCTIHVIPNFIDTSRYNPERCSETRARFAPRGEKVLMHVSNFRPVKRVGDVVRVFAAVQAETPARLLLVGDGPDLPAAEALAEELGVREHVEVLGQQSSVERLLRAADLFLLPSETESFGLAALEAMACGVPPLVSDVGGLPEVVEDGVSGILCPVGDVGAMAARALELMGDRKAHAAMASAARLRAVERFDRSIGVHAYESLYRELLGA